MTTQLPKHYPARDIERKWQTVWEEKRVFAFDPGRPGPIFSVDTPPPTVSGLIHIGHVFSYTQAEILIRYRRMRGYNVFYPFGFDDNGLPTERFVENAHGVRARDMSRQEFIRLCSDTVLEAEQQYEALWRSLGLSADWTQCYRTIDERSRRISQRSFLDLLRRDLLRREEAPTLWCPTCRTALAQADLEDQELAGEWYRLRFGGPRDDQPLLIATTRPELLPACAALIHHPDDERYRALTGGEARVPHAGHTVPILADQRADPEKGTGIVMCCTFGDQTDIEWWRQFNLTYRSTFTPNGRLQNSGEALDGLTIREGRKKIVALLEEAGELEGREGMRHPVKVHERCQTPVEFAISQQWFVRVLDRKPQLLAMGDRVRWYPDYMKTRYTHWVENLSWDWCISRQRYYGVPIPVWYCRGCGAVVPATDTQLPVDPLVDTPPGPCPACGGTDHRPDEDVLDTWATSSLTPQINAHWGEPEDRSASLMPMSMRPQAHDIIRTWAFYTIVKASYHHDDLPWGDAVISGHVQQRAAGKGKKGGKNDRTGRPSKLEKISKSKLEEGAISTPADLIEEWSADAVRYWTAGASLGTDMAYDLKEMNQGKRFLTKLYNATKFALTHLEGYDGAEPGERWPLDAWALASFRAMVTRVRGHYEAYDFFHARLDSDAWFWGTLCDNYLELVKGRLYAGLDGQGAPAAPGRAETDARLSARATLYTLLLGLYKLFAPLVPHITEELYQHVALERDRRTSIHIDSFPDPEAYPDDPGARAQGDQAVEVLRLVRRYKTTHKLAMNAPLGEIRVAGLGFDPSAQPRLMADLELACRSATIVGAPELSGEDVLSEGAIHVMVAPVEAPT